MKNRIFLIGLTSCFLGLVGCNNEETDVNDLQSGKVLMNMLVNVPQTRADYTESGTNMLFSWRNGDEISVVVDDVIGNSNCRLSTSTEGNAASFTGSVFSFTGTKNIYAFYPYSSSGYTVTGGNNSSTATVSLNLSNPQTYTINGAIKNSIIVGAGTATYTGGNIDANVSMKQVMSIVRLNITHAPGKISGVKIICSESLLPTTATVRLSDATIVNVTSHTDNLSMNVTDPTTDANKWVSFAMFPADLTGKTMSIEVTFQGGYIKSISKVGKSFQRNKHYTVAFDAIDAFPYVEFGELKWAAGNLVANGVNGAKIGSPADGGLYFQYGSLVGWSGGATGDGTGRGDNTTPALSQTVVPSGYAGNSSWNTSLLGDVSTDDPAGGIGDPCRYYLGEPWRLPTNADWQDLISNASGYPSAGPWVIEGTFVLNSTNSYLINNVTPIKFAASGYRESQNGDLEGVGEFGEYPSSSTGFSGTDNLHFSNFLLSILQSFDYYVAHPVRCVRN